MTTPAHTAGIERMIELFGTFPGIGSRTAERMAYHLLNEPDGRAAEMADAIRRVIEKTGACTVCFNYAEEPLCRICSDDRRESGLICVVERQSDVVSIEKTGAFKGVYHVLQGRIAPMDGIGPEDLTLEALLARIERGGVDEVILATNPTMEGDATAHYINGLLAERHVRTSRIARGLPAGSQLDYASKAILTDAMEGRREL